MAADPAVRVEGLTKSYGDVAAVSDLSFDVGTGQVFGLLGPNGAGKTTTLRMLLGLVRPSRGRAAIFGQEMRPGAAVLGDVGALVESPGFVPHLSGRRNLELFWAAGDRRHDDPHMDAALAVAKLGAAIDRRVRTYSHGMRQRLGLAQALLGRPRLVVLDEPTNGLDPAQMREIRELIGRLAESGTTVLLSSHLLTEVEQICSHAAVMAKGALVAVGTVDELTGESHAVYLDVDDRASARAALAGAGGVTAVEDEGGGLLVRLDGTRPSEVVARLVHAGVAVEQAVSRRRLEDAFLDLVSGREGP